MGQVFQQKGTFASTGPARLWGNGLTPALMPNWRAGRAPRTHLLKKAAGNQVFFKKKALPLRPQYSSTYQ